MPKTVITKIFFSSCFLVGLPTSFGFLHGAPPAFSLRQWTGMSKSKQAPFSALGMSVLDEEEKVIEESRREVLQSRRLSIRSTLRSAENFRNFRLSKGWVPELDPETGEPVSSDGKTAVTFTAFAVAAGAIALRFGGRAALISAVGLDFAKDNPELKQQLEQVLGYANSLDFGTEIFFFALAWTAVKVFCFDAGGIVLAIASGVIFGGVWQGALASAASATVGSLVCFGLAKLDTPVRKQALSVVEEYPSLRGIERVVAQDGFKAILTLRLAPVLPIPLGLYNYVYGVTNVPVFDFAAGIFLGSLKPYLLDSYLGYFGKTILDGSAASEAVGMQDIILLFAIGLSVLIGVFASQLAGETWDTVLKEIEEEEKLKNPDQEEELISLQVAGIDLPEWMVDWQIQWGMAEERMLNLVDAEIEAQVWNFSKPELIPIAQNPALAPDSPEVRSFGKGFDFGANTMDGLVLSPVLFSVFTKFSDPLYAAETQSKTQYDRRKFFDLDIKRRKGGNPKANVSVEKVDISMQKERLLQRLSELKSRTQRRLDRLNSTLLAQESEDNQSEFL